MQAILCPEKAHAATQDTEPDIQDIPGNTGWLATIVLGLGPCCMLRLCIGWTGNPTGFLCPCQYVKFCTCMHVLNH